ncbi:MAG: HaeII family restriction endonuclease [Campylobacteraceae bacterium]|jgi:type II restriction enzyme|nr:HaeII family restriction endonuclease [Campylobacteraceae bacterium]
MDVKQAKTALDTVIKKSRVHLYKPIQVAEILYHHRTNPNTIDLLRLDDYRNQSKKWRDDISLALLGRRCTSTARFQDDLFNDNATPPEVLNVLGQENIRTGGAVEAYIYGCFTNKHTQLTVALKYCLAATRENFQVITFINSFRDEAGLKRSIDKIYEVIVYALFSTLVSALELKVEISINPDKHALLSEFTDFAQMVMCLDVDTSKSIQSAKVFRVGVTNAADRGLDMYSNWGPAIQIKHLNLNEELAEEIVDGVSSDKIVIVCKDAEERVIFSLLNQIGWRNKIQSIITETNLANWYEKALRGKYSDILGDELLSCLCSEISNEFPSLTETPDMLKERGYEKCINDYWV